MVNFDLDLGVPKRDLDAGVVGVLKKVNKLKLLQKAETYLNILFVADWVGVM